MKKVTSVLLIAFLLLLGATPAFASQKSVKEGYGSLDSTVGIESYQLIADGYSKIYLNSDGSISTYGVTETFYPVDEVGVTLTLQYYTDGRWQSYSPSYTTYSYSSDFVQGLKVFDVPGGFNYRVSVLHTASNGTLNETGKSVSSSVYVP